MFNISVGKSSIDYFWDSRNIKKMYVIIPLQLHCIWQHAFSIHFPNGTFYVNNTIQYAINNIIYQSNKEFESRKYFLANGTLKRYLVYAIKMTTLGLTVMRYTVSRSFYPRFLHSKIHGRTGEGKCDGNSEKEE